MSSMNRWVLLISLLALVALSGCRSRRAVSAGEMLPPTGELSPGLLLDELLTRSDGDTSAQMKASALISFDGNAARSRVQIRWRRDRAIQVSILPLMGVEIARLVLTPDTIHLIDRYHKQYAVVAVGEWTRRSPLDLSFETVQSLFLARPAWPGGAMTPGDLSLFATVADGTGGYAYTARAAGRACDNRFTIDNRACLTTFQWRKPHAASSLSGRYAGYGVAQDRISPREMALVLSAVFEGEVSFSLENMEYGWNAPQNISAHVPSSYQRTDLQTWIETISR